MDCTPWQSNGGFGQGRGRMCGQRPVATDVTALGEEWAGSRRGVSLGHISTLDRWSLEMGLCCRVPESQAGPKIHAWPPLKPKALWVS